MSLKDPFTLTICGALLGLNKQCFINFHLHLAKKISKVCQFKGILKGHLPWQSFMAAT
jgi:hypothetical protein